DRSPARLEAVERAAGRLGATIVRTLAADASRPMELGDMPPAGFDAVLLDAPCTGLGVLRRTPDIKLRRTEGDIKRSSELQGELLANLSASVARGGRLVYSVCTFEPEETDEVVDAFLSTHRDFSAEDARGCLPPACGPLVDEGGRLRTMPHRGGMDGFFAARLRRN
ncbi:MAG: RsmB/NOP family class I SAM-dependent RNA methyltransferase, partial [Thermodesulfobacteriota bacterium]